jgi:EAL domain-containing protein (putative c-di-GMP-specific phosphodiesterase class I)
MRSIVSLCTSLGVECVVEGVSNEKQAEVLSEMGAPYLQGFYFSRALTQPQLLKYLACQQEAGKGTGEDVRWSA